MDSLPENIKPSEQQLTESANLTARTIDSVDNFGSINSTPRNDYEFHNLEFVFEKNRSSGCFSCCKNFDRKVQITTTEAEGRAIVIDSQKHPEKNIIPFSYYNPIVEITEDIVKLKRTDGSHISLYSQNPALITLFTSHINEHRASIKQFYELLWKWTNCYQSLGIRLINSIKTIKEMEIKNRTNTLRYEDHINKMSKHFITTALRYLTNHLQHGPYGYTNLIRYFFKKWSCEYNKNCIKESIRKNYDNIKRTTNLFGDGSHLPMVSKTTQNRVINKTTNILNHVNSVNSELKHIVQNLQNITYCSNENAVGDYNDSEKLTIVKNLQQLADLRHHLQSFNNEEEEFILVGDQSSGKSSLLCMLLGVNIGYTSEHFATRCPVRYVLEPCTPSSGWKYQLENPQTKEFEAVSQEELQKKLTTHFEKVIGRQIVYNPITIKIWSPVCTSSMTLVDLPGLVGKGSGADRVKEAQHKKSYEIVNQYLSKQNNIVLFVQRVDLDPGSMNTTILDEVQRRTPDKVVYCLTHFDRLCSDKDVRIEEIMRIISAAGTEVACNKDIFLLSLSKRVEDLKEKEHCTWEIIEKLKAAYPEKFRKNNIHFNIKPLKKFLRKNIHKHVNQIEGVIYQFISQQREFLTEQNLYINRTLIEPIINDVVLEQFIELFKKKTIKLLKGQFLPEKTSHEQTFFESLSVEVHNANKYAIQHNVAIWPPSTMKKRLPKAESSSIDNLDTASSCSNNEGLKVNTENTDGDAILVFEHSPRSNADSIDSPRAASDITQSVKLSIIPEDSTLDDIDNNYSYYGENMDSSLQRDLVSHALFTRTIYELQIRLWSVFLSPRYQDIIYAIATDPNINLDGPKDAIYCVMTHTIKQQLSMNNFFNYALKRLEYVLYKIIRYVLWFIQNSPDTPNECLILLARPEFQAILEIEIHKYCTQLSTNTYKELTTVFDEIMSAPIIVSHALRYKEMLITNFGWTEEKIAECTSNDIFRPRPINVEQDPEAYNQEVERKRAESIQNLITLHIHVRLIMITEHMVRSIDFNWRRMLDDSKEYTFLHSDNNLFSHIKNHVLRSVNINDNIYSGEYLYKLYSGDEQTKLEGEKQTIETIQTALDDILATCELLPNLMTTSMKIAGDKFL